MRSRIEPSGCARKEVRERWIVWGIVVLVALLFSGAADADYPSPFYYFTSSNFTTNAGQFSYINNSNGEGIHYDSFGACEGCQASINQTKIFTNTNYDFLNITLYQEYHSNSEFVTETKYLYINDIVYYSCSKCSGITYVNITPFGNGTYEIKLISNLQNAHAWNHMVSVFQVKNYVTNLPGITSWSNNKTNNQSLNITVSSSDNVNFNATADQPITTWTWIKGGVDQSNNFDNFTTSFPYETPSDYQFHLSSDNATIPQSMWDLMNHDGNDTTFSSEDGSINYPFWIEYLYARDNYSIWVNVSEANVSRMRWKYNVSGASSASNGTNTFLKYHGYSNTNFGDSIGVTVPFIYQARARHTAGTSYAFGVNPGSSTWEEVNHIAMFSYSSGADGYAHHRKDGALTQDGGMGAWGLGTWHDIKISATSTNVEHTGSGLVTKNIGTNIPTASMGLFMAPVTDGSGEQDYSFVRKYASPEPILSSISAPISSSYSTVDFIAGYTVTVSGTNANGTSNTITWNVVSQAPALPPSTVTISCPIGWCYLAQNYTSKTLLELDNSLSTDTIQGRYNATSQKYESHRTGYNFNQNVSVAQKEGYYYYFSSAQDVTMTPGSTPSITLRTGWNLVGNYGSSARTLSALKSSIGAVATQAKYYDRSSKTWVSTDSQSVPAMESFFVYVTSQTDWSG